MPTSESINFTLSWICIQPLLLGDGENLGWPILSPPWKVKVSTSCAENGSFISACQLGMRTVTGSILTSGKTFFLWDLVMKKFLWPFSTFRWFQRGSCQLCIQPLLLGDGEKLGRPVLSAPWKVKASTSTWAGPFFPHPEKWKHQLRAPGTVAGSVRIRLVCGRLQVQSSRPAKHSFVEIWSWKNFYDHSLPSGDSRRAVVSYWRKNGN